MKKISLLLFTCLVKITFIFSQTKENGFISVVVGPAFPMGKFTSRDFSDPLAGFAKAGESFSLSYSKLISKTLGIQAEIRGQRNPIATKEFERRFAEALTQYPNWKVDKQAWLSGAVLLGGMGQFPLHVYNKLSLTTKGMIGVLCSKSPGLKATSVNGSSFANIEQSKKSAIGFTYSVGGGINYNLKKRLFIAALVTYNGSNTMTYKDVRTVTFTSQGMPGSPEHSVQQSISILDGQQAISSINIQTGLGIRL